MLNLLESKISYNVNKDYLHELQYGFHFYKFFVLINNRINLFKNITKNWNLIFNYIFFISLLFFLYLHGFVNLISNVNVKIRQYIITISCSYLFIILIQDYHVRREDIIIYKTFYYVLALGVF